MGKAITVIGIIVLQLLTIISLMLVVIGVDPSRSWWSCFISSIWSVALFVYLLLALPEALRGNKEIPNEEGS